MDDVRRQCKAVLDALNRTDFHVDIGSLKSIKMKDMEIKSAKALFGDTEKKIENVKELPESIRNLLLAGALIMKHSNTAAPRQRHVYITPDLKSVTHNGRTLAATAMRSFCAWATFLFLLLSVRLAGSVRHLLVRLCLVANARARLWLLLCQIFGLEGSEEAAAPGQQDESAAHPHHREGQVHAAAREKEVGDDAGADAHGCGRMQMLLVQARGWRRTRQ